LEKKKKWFCFQKLVGKYTSTTVLLPLVSLAIMFCHLIHPGVNFTNILLAAFRTKVFCAAFMCLQFGFVIFWQKDFGTKAAHKMLVK
jgi:hypothetical protein